MPIEFRCLQCQHPQTVDESKIGQQVYCRVCYYKLTVPAESTVKPIEDIQPSELYALDTTPTDIQKMQERREELISFPCNLCQTLIGVRKEQVGETLLCPECGTTLIVPKLVATIAETRRQDKLNKMWALHSRKETYSLSSKTGVPANPANDGPKQFRVPCQLCGTAMFATEEQIGTFLTCHDCGTKTEVLPPQKEIETPPVPATSFEGSTTYNIATASSVWTQERFVPVVCKHCGTRMYATESEIGEFKTCPDCGRQTEIKFVPKQPKTKTSTTSADAYILDKGNALAPRPAFRMFFRSSEEWLAELARRATGRPPLPKRPLTERFFVPFGYAGTWLSLIMFVAVAPLGATVLLWATRAGGGIGMLTFGIPVVFTCAAMFCYLASFTMQLYDSTCGGMDEFEYRGEIAPADYFAMGFWLFTFSAIAAIPGWLIGTAVALPLDVMILMMRISHWLFFPIFFLSCMEAGSIFALLARNMVASLWNQSFAWFRFYLLTGILLVISVFSDACFFYATFLFAVVTESPRFVFMNALICVVLFTVSFFLFAIQFLFFFRLLGRHAWLLEETARMKYERERKEEDEKP